MKKAITVLHIVFAVIVLAGVVLYFTEAGITWPTLIFPLGILAEGASFVLQIIGYRREKTKRSVYMLTVTGILLLVMLLALAQFLMFVIL